MKKMRSVLRLLPAAIAIVCALPAAGQPQAPQQQVFKQGSDLHEALQQDGPASSNALNYIVGVVDALNGTRSKDGSCFQIKGEEAVTGARIAQVVRAFLLQNPQSKERPGSGVVAAALAQTWPCG